MPESSTATGWLMRLAIRNRNSTDCTYNAEIKASYIPSRELLQNSMHLRIFQKHVHSFVPSGNCTILVDSISSSPIFERVPWIRCPGTLLLPKMV